MINKFRPLYLEVSGMPWIYTGHHKWLVGQALNRKIAGYMALDSSTYGTSVSIAKQRNELIDYGLKTDATHFVFVDWDVVPPVDVFERLNKHNLDIVGGVYYSKDLFKNPLIFKKNNDGNYKNYQGSGLEEVDFISAGLSLIKREVYERLPKPWYYSESEKYTEDFYFCMKAQEAGYKIYCDFDIIAEHYGVFSNRDKVLKINKDFINTL